MAKRKSNQISTEKEMKKIEVTPEVRAQLREEHCLVNDQTVYKALRYETDGPLAKMIRRRALELGGKEWMTADEVGKIDYCPDCAMAGCWPCDREIPCCHCSEKDCNSRQVCQKKSA